VRIGNWKLIRHDGTAVIELYDLAADPSETSDLSAKDPDRVASMAATLDRWLTERSAARARPAPH
jgi:arylsulfatase A-like enzyme